MLGGLRPAPARRDAARDLRRDPAALVRRPADARHRRRGDLDASARRRAAAAALRRQPVEAAARIGVLHRLEAVGGSGRAGAPVRADGHAAPVRRRRPVGLAPGPAVVHVRALLRRALHADRARAHARGARRALHPHRAREGSVGAARDPLARTAERDRAGRDDGGDGRRDGDRDRHVHRDGLRLAGARPDDDPRARRLQGYDLPVILAVTLVAARRSSCSTWLRTSSCSRSTRRSHGSAGAALSGSPAARREDPRRLADVPGAGRPRPRLVRRAAGARAPRARARGRPRGARSPRGRQAPLPRAAPAGRDAPRARRRLGALPRAGRACSRRRSTRRSSSRRTAATSATSAPCRASHA